LKIAVSQQIFQNAITKSDIFSQKTEVIEFMVSHVALWLSLPEENIVQQSTMEQNGKVYFIA
jgi:hypothetical protein